MKRITIQMLAESVGVSRGTVDRVLHDRPSVKPEIRERVLRVAQKSGYLAQITAEEADPKRIAVVLPGSGWFTAELRREWLRGVEDAKRVVEPLGFEVTLVECETDLPNEIAEKIAQLKSQGLDALAISAKNSPVMQQVIGGLVSEGIPVVTFNSDLPESDRQCFVGQDLYRSGKVAASLICKLTGRRDHILMVAGNLEIDAHNRRVQGFRDKCVAEGIAPERLYLAESYNEYVLTYNKISEALARDPALRAIYMANESVPACVEAIRRSGRREKIMVVGNDLSVVTRKLLASEEVDFIIEQNVYGQGYRPVLLLKKLLTEPGIRIQPLQFTDISIINAENMEDTDEKERENHWNV